MSRQPPGVREGGSQMPSEADWPFPERRHASLGNPDYLGCGPLVRELQAAIASELAGSSGLSILDVGCGRKPFFPFFGHCAGRYLGTDIVPGSEVDIVCPAEQLQVPDEWADVVLCLSVLEHVDDPAQVVREIHRVLKPDGVLFASTHGTFPWHPHPQDHWRWTQTGLRRLFELSGGFSRVELRATRGSFSGIFFFLAHCVYAWVGQGRIRWRLRRPATALVNRIGEFVDRRTPGWRDLSRPVTMIPEFFVVARR